VRKAIYGSAVALGVDRLLRWRRPGGIVLCYHNIVADADAPPGDRALHLSVSAFEAHVEFLAQCFSVISLAELVRRQSAGQSMRGTAAITFDDGYRGVLVHALPLLRARGLPAAMFITSRGASDGNTFWWDWPAPGAEASTPRLRSLLLDECRGDAARVAAALDVTPIEADAVFRPASWSELRSSAGPDITIGVHTVSHQNLAVLDDEMIRQELAENVRDIERELGSRPKAVAYPYGSWTPRVVEAASELRLELGLTLDGHDVRPSTNLLSVPRVNIPASLSTPAFRLWASGLADIRGR
jgi:peptidoglycan/xylan/chitin deacetylase (PgdA/CDA1 family)